jgi:hypothetical protein
MPWFRPIANTFEPNTVIHALNLHGVTFARDEQPDVVGDGPNDMLHFAS